VKYRIRQFLVALAVPGFFSGVWLAGVIASPGPLPGWALPVACGVPLAVAGSVVLVLLSLGMPRPARRRPNVDTTSRQEASA
jgi:hypothetical protein